MSNANQVTVSTIYRLCYWISEHSESKERELSGLANEEYFLSIVALANQCWIVGALTHGIKQKKQWEALPALHREYLTEISQVYEERAVELVDEIVYSVKLLNHLEITPILLKGAATLLNGVAVPRSIRYMNDIDMLVKPEELEYATQEMVAQGYTLDDEAYDIEEYEHHHQSPMKRNTSKCYIELHRWHTKNTLLTLLPSSELWHSAKLIPVNEPISVRECSATHQIIINIVHSELSDRGYFEKDIHLFQLVALFQLVNFYRDEIDWQKVASHFMEAGVQSVLYSRLYALIELFNIELPLDNKNLQAAENKKHFKCCLSNYIDNQNGIGLKAVLQGQLSEYSKLSIKVHYGVDKFWGILRVRCKIFKNQIKKLTNKNYLKKFFLANFN